MVLNPDTCSEPFLNFRMNISAKTGANGEPIYIPQHEDYGIVEFDLFYPIFGMVYHIFRECSNNFHISLTKAEKILQYLLASIEPIIKRTID